MSDFKFNCPFCGQKLAGEREWVGEATECPRCHKCFNIPKETSSGPRMAIPVGGSPGNVPPPYGPPPHQQFQNGNNTRYAGEPPMHCTNCGREIAANAAICIHCGVAVGIERNFCANCGSRINPNQAICLGCGYALTPMNNRVNKSVSAGAKTIQPSGKSASTAMILSCLIAGLGQIYLGQTIKGVVIIVAGIALGIVTMGISAPVVLIIAMVDAYQIGKKLEAGQCVGEWEFF